MLTWAIENTVVAGLLALVAIGVCYLLRSRPALCHLVWVLVLVRLVIPPLPTPGWPPEQLRNQVSDAAVALGIAEQDSLMPPPSVAAPSKASIEVWRGEPLPRAWSEKTASYRRAIESDFAMSARPDATQSRQPSRSEAEGTSTVYRQSRADGTEFTVGPSQSPLIQPETPASTWYQAEAEREHSIVPAALSAEFPGGIDAAAKAAPPTVPEPSEPLRHEVERAVISGASGSEPASPAVPSQDTAAYAEPAHLSDWALIVWASGSLIVLLVQTCRIVRLQRMIRRATPAGEVLTDTVHELARRIGVRQPRIRVHSRLASPAVWCLGRPVLLWPEALVEPHQIEANRGVIAHELAHLRRHDHWIAWLEVLATTLLWWNPLFWLVRSRVRYYSELACDAWVVWAMPTQKRRYAEALIETVARLSAGCSAYPALGAVDNDRRSFEQRVRLIMNGSTTCRITPSLATPVVFAAAIAVPSWSFAGDWIDTGRIPRAVADAAAAQHQQRKAGWYFQTRSYADAAEAYQSVLETDPTSELARWRLVESMMALSRHDEAITLLDELAETDPSGEAHFLAATAAAAAGDTAGAQHRVWLALERGFDDVARIKRDQHLGPLVSDTRCDTSAEQPSLGLAITAMQTRRDLMDRARRAERAGQWEQIAALYRRAAGPSPLDGSVVQRLGYSLMRAGLFDDAVRSFKSQLQLGHESAFAYYNIACAHSLGGRTSRAIDALRSAVEAGFDSIHLVERDTDLDRIRSEFAFLQLQQRILAPYRLQHRINRMLELERFEEALHACDELLELSSLEDEQVGWIHHREGLAHFGLGETARAARAFTKQVRLGFWVEEGLYRLACCSAAEGNDKTALTYLGRAIEAGLADEKMLAWFDDEPILARVVAHPSFERIRQQVSDLAILEQRFKAADWEHLRKMREAEIAADPQNGYAHLQLGWSYLRLGAYDKAVDVFLTQEQMGFLPGIACYNIACAFALKNEPDRAMYWLKRSRDTHDFYQPADTRRDLDLANLRGDARFEKFLSKS